MKYTIKYSGPREVVQTNYGIFDSEADAKEGLRSAVEILGGAQVSRDGDVAVLTMLDNTPRVLQITEIHNLEDLF